MPATAINFLKVSEIADNILRYIEHNVYNIGKEERHLDPAPHPRDVIVNLGNPKIFNKGKKYSEWSLGGSVN